MEITIRGMGAGAAEILSDTDRKTAVVTKLSSRIFKQITPKELLEYPGFVVRENETIPWHCGTSTEYKGNLLFPGAYYKGNTVEKKVPDITMMIKINRGFLKALEEGIPVGGFYPPGIFLSEAGDLIFFPPALVNYISSHLSEAESLEFWQPYNHPDTEGDTAYSFILGVLGYRMITGEMPYTGDSTMEIREKMRRSKPVEVQEFKPETRESIASIINRSLQLKDVSLAEWSVQLELWKENGEFTESPDHGITESRKTFERKQTRRQKQFKRKQFLLKHWKTLAALLAGVIVTGFFLAGPIKAALRPPSTLGLSAEDVVKTYYKAMAGLDVSTMEDCISRKAGKSDLREITNLYVMTRVRSGYEGKTGLISARDWEDGKVPAIPTDEQVYGITDLTISKTGKNRFTAVYNKWVPAASDNPDAKEALPPVKTRTRDILTLETKNDVWIITSLKRETKE